MERDPLFETCPRCASPYCGEHAEIPHTSSICGVYDDGGRDCLCCYWRDVCRFEARERRRKLLRAARRLRAARPRPEALSLPLPSVAS